MPVKIDKKLTIPESLAKVFIKNNWAEPVQKDKPEVKKMNDFEKCKKLRNSIGEFADKTIKLKEKVAEKIKAQRILDEDALKAEILEEKDWEKKKEAAKRNREDILRLKEKIEENQKAIERGRI